VGLVLVGDDKLVLRDLSFSNSFEHTLQTCVLILPPKRLCAKNRTTILLANMIKLSVSSSVIVCLLLKSLEKERGWLSECYKECPKKRLSRPSQTKQEYYISKINKFPQKNTVLPTVKGVTVTETAIVI
jgi:hypothetical protein